MSAAIQSYSRSWAGPPLAVCFPAFETKKKSLPVPGCRVCVFCSSTGSSAETWGTSCPLSDHNCVGWFLWSFWFIAEL